MFKKVLIANRGEIAVRIIRACRELGVRAVAAYSEADGGALHVRLADEAVLIGPAPPAESYLHGERIVAAAKATGCEAVHPGYGFLSENAGFAQMVRDAGLIFVGPTPEAIRRMGSKTTARAIVQAAGVPVVPGYHGGADAGFEEAAGTIGYPVLVKAAGGGGGRGMRVVRRPAELAEAVESAEREAAGAFGDSSIFLEKYVEDARHVEFQILGDAHGNIAHLFERECSVQRRHQKIIEESPSPLMGDRGGEIAGEPIQQPATGHLRPAPGEHVGSPLRVRMAEAAVAAARAVGYQNAGTVEFIVDPGTRRFYFLEMNTRLQVEHPVTELVTGVDLVKAQLRVAAGEPLWFRQGDLVQRGHALECRVYAEDPAHEFVPSIGRALTVVEPRGPGVRVDSGVESGDEITRHYDPMIAKVIVHAETREDAIRRMEAALADFVILGVTTNLPFLRAVLAHPVFRRGEATTGFIAEHFSGWRAPDGASDEVLIAAALAGMTSRSGSGQLPLPDGDTAGEEVSGPWGLADGFRLGG